MHGATQLLVAVVASGGEFMVELFLVLCWKSISVIMSCWCGDGHFTNEVQVLLLVVGQLEIDPCEVTVQECGQATLNKCILD